MRIALAFHQVEYSIPLGLAYCAAVLKERGFECQAFEVGFGSERVVKEIVKYAPQVIGFSAYSGSHQFLLSFCLKLKKRLDFVSVFGGAHPTFFPEMIESPGVDAICRGEGELAFAEFAEKYRRSGNIPTDVANFLVKNNKQITENPPRPLLMNLDLLPFPDRMFFIEKYPTYNTHGVKDFVAHRGCPYRCSYCFNHVFNELYGTRGRECYRSRSPEIICEEILLEQSRMRLEMVSFVDDCFTLDKEETLNFCDLYKRKVGLPFRVNTRVENLDKDIVKALASANCWLVHVGVESGDEDYRRRVLKRGMSNRLIRERIKNCLDAGIRVLTENMVGLPLENYKGVSATLKLNMEIQPHFATASFFMPYPQLELTQFAIEQGVYDPKTDELPIDYMHSSCLEFPTPRDKRRILNLRAFFNLAIHHPRLWPLLNKLTYLPPNPFFRLMGDLIDGYYLWKLLPYRTGIKNSIRLIYRYLISYRKLVGREQAD